MIFQISFQLETAYEYDSGQNTQVIFVLVLYSLFLLNLFFFAGKTALEFSININKVTNFLEMVNLFIQVMVAVGRLTNLSIVN